MACLLRAGVNKKCIAGIKQIARFYITSKNRFFKQLIKKQSKVLKCQSLNYFFCSFIGKQLTTVEIGNEVSVVPYFDLFI